MCILYLQKWRDKNLLVFIPQVCFNTFLVFRTYIILTWLKVLLLIENVFTNIQFHNLILKSITRSWSIMKNKKCSIVWLIFRLTFHKTSSEWWEDEILVKPILHVLVFIMFYVLDIFDFNSKTLRIKFMHIIHHSRTSSST